MRAFLISLAFVASGAFDFRFGVDFGWVMLRGRSVPSLCFLTVLGGSRIAELAPFLGDLLTTILDTDPAPGVANMRIWG
jgi:hypothetical protein